MNCIFLCDNKQNKWCVLWLICLSALLALACDDDAASDNDGADASVDTDSGVGITDTDSGQKVPADATVIVIGDSIMAFNSWSDAGIADVLADSLGESVYDGSVRGAVWVDGEGTLDINNQYVDGEWDWIVLNGGGNDLLDSCECGACDAVLDTVINEDATAGELAEFVMAASEDGAGVVVLGYYLVPETALMGFAACNDWLATYSARISLLAENNPDVLFVEGTEYIEPSQVEFYFSDNVHPSEAGSQVLGQAIADAILNY